MNNPRIFIWSFIFYFILKVKLHEPWKIISLFSTVQIWVLRAKRFIFTVFVFMFFPFGSDPRGSCQPNRFIYFTHKINITIQWRRNDSTNPNNRYGIKSINVDKTFIVILQIHSKKIEHLAHVKRWPQTIKWFYLNLSDLNQFHWWKVYWSDKSWIFQLVLW